MSACARPLSFESIVAYVHGELPSDEEDAVEAHLFSCPACTRAALEIEALTRGLAAVLPPVLSRERLARLRAAGLRLGETVVHPGEHITAHFTNDLDLMVHGLVTDAREGRVDMEVLGDGPAPLVTVEIVPVDEETGRVYVTCERHYAARFPNLVCFRLVAVREGGSRIVLADYRVNHELT